MFEKFHCTVPFLSKTEITIDSNGYEGQLY